MQTKDKEIGIHFLIMFSNDNCIYNIYFTTSYVLCNQG